MSPRKATVAPPIDRCVCGLAVCDIPFGYCHCGCGSRTAISPFTNCPNRHWKGFPTVCVVGHGNRHRRPELVQPDNPLIRHIALTQGQIAEVDDWNYSKLMKYTWSAWLNLDTRQYYAKTNIKEEDGGGTMLMHLFLMNPPDGFVVDHIDRNTLRNVESNLRLATTSQNAMNHKQFATNSSGYTGVKLHLGKYDVSIRFNYENIYIGRFANIVDAVAARRAKEIELFGEYSRVQRDEEANKE